MWTILLRVATLTPLSPAIDRQSSMTSGLSVFTYIFSLYREAIRASSASLRVSRVFSRKENESEKETEREYREKTIESDDNFEREHAALKDEIPVVPTVAGSICPLSGWRGGCWSLRWPAYWSTKRETKS